MVAANREALAHDIGIAGRDRDHTFKHKIVVRAFPMEVPWDELPWRKRENPCLYALGPQDGLDVLDSVCRSHDALVD